MALDRLGLERLVCFPQFLGSIAHCRLELGGAIGFALGLATSGRILAKRLHRNHTQKDRSDPHNEPKPTEIIGQLVCFRSENLALRDPLAKRDSFGGGDLIEFGVQVDAGLRLARFEEIDRSALTLLEHRSPGR